MPPSLVCPMFKTKSAGLVHYYNDNHKITPVNKFHLSLKIITLSVIYYFLIHWKKTCFVLKTTSFYTVGAQNRIVLFEGFKA